MNRNRKSNGFIETDPKQLTVNRLRQQLSNSQRELQLSEQIRTQLEKICETSKQVTDITNKLLYQMEDLTTKQMDDLHKKERAKKEELRELEDRLQMLREIEANECRLNVKLMAYKKTEDNALLIGGRKVKVDGSGDNNDLNYDEDTDVDESSEYEESVRLNRRPSDATEVDSWHTFEMEGELNELSPKRTGRKRVIPKRFESFPSGSKRFQRLNGYVVGILFVLVLAIIVSILIHYKFVDFEGQSVDSVREVVVKKWQTVIDYLPVFRSQFV